MNIDTSPETTETRETKSVEQTEKLSPTGISAMQGQDVSVQSEQVEKPLAPADTPPPPDQPLDDDFVTVYRNPKGPEYLPSKETEPISVRKSDIEPPEEPDEDTEGKPSQPPEGWRPGGPEGGG